MRPRYLDMDQAVRIQFLQGNGSLTKTPVQNDVIPVVEVSVLMGGQEQAVKVSALALIDTGADHCCIDIGLANTLQLEPAGFSSFSGVGGTIENAPYFNVVYEIRTPSGARLITATSVSAGLAETGRKYQLIFGMSFIQKGRLILDSKVDEYLFEFHSP